MTALKVKDEVMVAMLLSEEKWVSSEKKAVDSCVPECSHCIKPCDYTVG